MIILLVYIHLIFFRIILLILYYRNDNFLLCNLIFIFYARGLEFLVESFFIVLLRLFIDIDQELKVFL